MSKKASVSHNLSGLRLTRRKLYVAMLAASQLMGAGQVMAAPEGGVVVGGAGTIDQSGAETTIHQSTERMAIDWKSFDVQSNERVQFIQPKSTSIALNRVVSNKGSEILGRIDANGQVFLINPNGVVFGKDSQVNVGGMLASGLSIDPQDFMNGEFTLNSIEGSDGKVINSGIINASTGGSVTLIGQQVKNEGLISANLGSVALAAGKEAVVTFDKAGLIGVKVTKEVLQNELGVDAAVINSGDINAQGGRILISASVSQDIFSDAVNNGGMNKASSVVVNEDGSFTLGAGSDVINSGDINVSSENGDAGQVVVLGDNITNSGNIHADAVNGTGGNIELHSTDITALEQNSKVTAKASSQGRGGDVKILGNKVGLFDQAEVNASGANGGGQVLIGGDKTGDNIKIRNADFIYLGESSSVKNDGLINGNGGKLITFASDTARIYGSLSARGGIDGGNGGFIETSGLKGFDIANTPDIGAAAGYAGTWLIDPDDIIIGGTAENMFSFDDADSNGSPLKDGKFIFQPTNAGSARLRVSVLESALSAGGTVIVKTTGAQGNITLASELKYDFTGAGWHKEGQNNVLAQSNQFSTLEFQASGDIFLNANIERETIDVKLTANDNTVKPLKNNNHLNITLNAKGDITFGKNPTTNTVATIDTNGGAFTAIGKNFYLKDGSIKTTVAASAQELQNLDVNAGSMTNGNVLITSLGDAAKAGGAVIDFGEVNTGNLTVLGDSDNDITTDTPANVNVIQSSVLVATGDAIFDVHDGKITLDGLNNFNKVSIKSANSASLVDTNSLTLGTSKISNGLSIKSGEFNTTNGGISQSNINDTLEVGGVTTLSAKGHLVDLSNKGNDFNLSVSTGTSSVGALKISDKNDITIGTVSILGTGDSSIAATDGILLNGNIATNGGTLAFKNKVTQSGNLEINAGTGNIAFEGDLLTAATANTLSLKGKDIRFHGDVGSSVKRTGNFTINAAGNVKADKGIYTTALEVEHAVDFTAALINTAGAADTDGGKLNVNATGTVDINSIDTHSGALSVPTGVDGVGLRGKAGGAVTIAGRVIKVGAVDTSGSDGGQGIVVPAQAEGGKAGDFKLTADTEITLKGEIKTRDGNGVAELIHAQLTLKSAGTVNIGASSFISQININGSGGEDTLKGFDGKNIWEINAVGSNLLNSKIAFDGFEHIEGGGADDTFEIGANRLTSIKGGVGVDTFNINIAGITGTFNGGDGDDKFNINAAITNGVLNGEAGADTFNVLAAGNLTATLDGGADRDQLISLNQENNWKLGGDTEKLNDNLSFSRIEDITGGALKDTFAFSGDRSVTGAIKAGNAVGVVVDDVVKVSGNATINLTAATLNGVQEAETIENTSDAEAKLTATSGTSASVTWEINASNSGNVNLGEKTVKFINFSDLTGGEGADTFKVATNTRVTGVIDGGGGSNNVLDIIDNSGFVSLAINSTDTSKILRLTGIDDIKGNGQAATQLSVASADNEVTNWFITGADTGRVEALGRTTTFSKIKNLGGGDGTDMFTMSAMGNIAGEINGGNGVNTLKGLDVDTDWHITAQNSGHLTLAGPLAPKYVNSFVAIQKLQGDLHVDKFIYSGSGRVSNADGGEGAGNFVNLEGVNTAYNFILGTSATHISDVTGNINNPDMVLEVLGGNNIWKVDGPNTGAIGDIRFRGFGKLKGGSGDDSFVFLTSASLASISRVVDVGGNRNVIDLQQISDFSAPYILDLGADGKFATFAASEVKGNGSAFLTLSAGNTNNTWEIDSSSEGLLKRGNSQQAKIKFSGFKNLAGGSGTDDFIFTGTGSAAGSIKIDGGGVPLNGSDPLLSKNTLTGRDIATTWSIAAVGQTAADGSGIEYASFSNIQTLNGGSNIDTFKIGVAFGGQMNGGDNNDIFYVNAQVKELSGGIGDDTFDFSQSLAGTAEVLDGGSFLENNKLIARSSDAIGTPVHNVWTVPADSNQKNTLSVGNEEGEIASDYVDDFRNIKNLVGGDGIDYFNVNVDGYNTNGAKGGNVTIVATARREITGGIGDDTYIFRDGGSADSIHDMGGDNNSIVARNGSNLWTINSSATSAPTNSSGPKNTLGEVNANGDVVLYLKDFSNIQNISGGKGSDKFVLNAALPGTDTDQGIIKGGAGNDEFIINTAVGDVYGDEGNDTFTLSANGSVKSIQGGKNLPDSPLEVNTLIGRNSENIWTLGKNNEGAVKVEGSVDPYVSFSVIQALQGGSLTDTLQGSDAKSTWRLSGAKNSGSVVDENGNNFQFSMMENLRGHDEVADTFVFAEGALGVAGLIDGGTSAGDELDLRGLTAGVTVNLSGKRAESAFVRATNIEVINAATLTSAKNKLIGASDFDYLWGIGDDDSGNLRPLYADGSPASAESIVTFTHFGVLEGGTNSDSFEVTAAKTITTNIDGGEGEDFINYAKNTANVEILLNSDGSFAVNGISSVENVVGNNDGSGEYTSTIKVENSGTSVWTLHSISKGALLSDGLNDGEVALGATNVFFENFNVIGGGAGDDVFKVVNQGKFIGSLQGGGGNNSVDLSAAANAQTLAINGTGTKATNLKDIHEVIGNGNSILVSENQANIWTIGASGAGKLMQVGAVNDQIIFNGFSRLMGGAQQDIFKITDIAGLKILMDGGIAVAGDSASKNSVDLTAVNSNVILGVGDNSKAEIKLVNINTLEANADNRNTLVAEEEIVSAAGAKSNDWLIDAEDSGILNNSLVFEGFANLLGGQGADVFTVAATGSITGVIDAGLGEDKLNTSAVAKNLHIKIVNDEKLVSNGDIHLINVEHLEANEAHTNTLSASDADNDWSIDSANIGSLTNLATKASTNFRNFANLIGGAGTDTFVFAESSSLSGYIDGGEGGLTKDIVNLRAKKTEANILMGSEGAGYRNIKQYIGNNTNSIFSGSKGDNVWNLGADKNSGDINSQIFFTGFTSLVGNEGNDTFNLLQGGLSGAISGGEGADTFNLGAGQVAGNLDGQAGDDILNVAIAAGSAARANFIGGAGSNSINVSGGGANYTAIHSSSGETGGLLNYSGQDSNAFSILYSDIGIIHDDLVAASLTLENTSAADIFTFSNNAYSLQNPLWIYYSNKNNLIVAGAADDKVAVTGEVSGLQSLRIQQAALTATATGLIRVADLHLNSIGNVGDATNRVNLSVDNLSVNAANGDIYLKDDGGLSIDTFVNNKGFDLQLAGDLDSKQALISAGDFVVDAAGNIALSQDNLLSGAIGFTAGGNINFHNLGATRLSNIKAQNLDINTLGAIDGEGEINVSGRALFASDDNIRLMNSSNHFNELAIGAAANVSVADKGILTLADINASGLLDTHSLGLNSKGTINVAELDLDAGAGDVTLAGLLDTSNRQTIVIRGNNITQGAKIISGGDVTIEANSTLIQTADIETLQNIAVTAGGDLTMNATATSRGDQVSYSAGGTMNLLGTILANNNLNIAGKKAVNQLAGLSSLNGDITVDAGQFIMSGDASLSAAKGSLLLTSADDITVRTLTAANGISLQAADLIQVNSAVTSTAAAVTLLATNNIALNGNLNANSGVKITSLNGDLNQQAQINTQQGDIVVLTGGDIDMGTGGISTAENGNINYAAKNIDLNLLTAKNGSSIVTARGAVSDGNGGALNLVGKGLNIVAATGIGVGDALETSVGEISLSNALGNIEVTNDRAVTISQLRSNGNIYFQNRSGNVVFNSTPVAGGEMPNRPVTNTTYNTNDLVIKVSGGNLLAAGAKSVDRPEIAATNVTLVVTGTIGLVNRPLIISSREIAASSRRTWRPIMRPGTIYTDVTGSSASASDITATSHEQLVQVETLAEVNPAIFTGVRNYVYDDVAILLPEDQRYDN